MTARTLRSWLADLPEFEEREIWGRPTQGVGSDVRDPGRGDGGRLAQGHPEEPAALEPDPRTFSWPAYVGRHGWVRVDLARVDPDQPHEIVVEAWRRTAPTRLVRAFDEEGTTA